MKGVSPSPSSSLAQIVCRWNPSQLTQLAKTYADACSPLQTTFTAYHSYKAYFEPLLLAEVSADLSSALEKYQRSTLRQPKLRAKREEPGSTLALVIVNRVSKSHNPAFEWSVDIESRDRRGPVGAVDNDVVALWPAETNPIQKALASNTPRHIPTCATLALVMRNTSRTACRLALAKFPDGNEHGINVDLEEGEENEQQPPKLRLWNLLRIGSLTTMRREFTALHAIKASVLLPKILRPHISSLDPSDPANATAPNNEPQSSTHRQKFHSEYFFTDTIVKNTKLNASQANAIIRASTCRRGFAVIQGPPGTGKTRTLIGLLNVIHMTQYQEYYESLLAQIDPMYAVEKHPKESAKPSAPQPSSKSKAINASTNGTGSSMLKDLMKAMTKTASSAASVSQISGVPLTLTAKRPRILICAPSNSALDEVLKRLTQSRLLDGRGKGYLPELARIGAGDRISEKVKHLTAERLAEAFLDKVCGEEMNKEAQKKAQMMYLGNWQNKVNSALVQLERLPKRKPSSREVIIDLHEKLERMERDLRRLNIAASGGKKPLSREEKLRQIARTYVEDAQLVFATLSGAASSILTKKGANDPYSVSGALFDTVIVDEAAQATETSTLIPMTLGASRCILIGDPNQLPATVMSSGVACVSYGQSMLERICAAGKNVELLNLQYRMHPAISSFPRRYFYNGKLKDDETVQGEHRSKPYHRDAIRPKLGPYVFLDISQGEERRSGAERSIFNPAEAELASLIYTRLKKEYSNDTLFLPESKSHGAVTGFGVVTPYKRQLQELRQSFDRAGIPTTDVEIDTVDSFQGREKDVIVFSCVRTAAANRGIGFVRDVRRMNVGLTRARSSLIILGSAEALAAGSVDWAELIDDASSRGCLIRVASVDRCLLPAPPDGDPLESSEPGREPMRDHQPSLPPSSTKPLPFHRSDPRKRVQKRDEPSKPAEIVVRPGANHHLVAAITQTHKADPRLAARGGHKTASRTQQSQQGKTSEQSNHELQSTLEQMTKLLAEAGFHNLKIVEKTLRDHIKNGGQLDVETVMAAAFASGAVHAENASKLPPASVQEVVEDPPKKEASEDHVMVEVKEKIAPPIAPKKEKPELPVPIKEEEKIQRKEPESEKEAETKKTSAATKRERSPVHMAKNGPSEKKPKKQKKERPIKHKTAQEPSGWDMLFGGGDKDKKESDEVKASSESSKPDKDSTIKSEASLEKNGEKDPRRQQKDENGEGRPSSSRPDRDPGASPVRQKRRWNEKEEGRKRRSGEYNGESYRNVHKRGRGQHHDHGGQEYGNGEQWGAQMGYDPNMAYQMMGNMGNMNPMLAFQQQALQQQMLQQQAFQQQAMQQAMLQQQAMQQNPFQPQAMPQEALAQQMSQQPLMMQMPMGMAPTAAGPVPYPGGGDIEGFNGNGTREGGSHNTGNNNNWGHNNYGRPSRGRGRGRGKGYQGKRWRGRN